MINVGIIGFGKMGKIRYQTLQKFKGVRVLSIYDPKIKSPEVNVDDVDSVIGNKDINVIFICTPNFLNKDLTIKSLVADKHVFCEKPPAFTSKDVKEICKVETELDKILMYGFNHRHHESIKQMKKIISSNEFGKILWMRGRYGKSVDSEYYDNWRAQKELAGGGILIDQGIHMLDLFLFLTDNNFDKIHASISNLYWNLDVEDNVFATLENSRTGVVASLHSTMTQWRHLFSLEVFLEKGYLCLNGLKTSSKSYGDEILSIAKNRSVAPAAKWKDEEHHTYHNDYSWQSEINHFFSCIRNKEKVKYGNSEDALKLMSLIDEIYKFRKG